jgi:hypothetical protein
MNYADANHSRAAGSGVGELKTPADFDRASEIALNARDSELFNRIRAVRAKMFGGAAGGRSAAGDLAKIDAVLRLIKNDEAREKPKRFVSPVAADMAALAGQCRRLASRADQARIAAALREGDTILTRREPDPSDEDWFPDDEDDEFDYED